MKIDKAIEEFKINFYTNIGCTIILCGLVENQLKTIVNEMQISSFDKVEFVNLFSTNNNVRMMGNLIKLLKDKYSLSNEFLDHLKNFTNRRNKLVHDLPIEYCQNTDDLVKLIETYIFVSELRKTSKLLSDVFSNIVITVASNFQNPINKKEIEKLFQSGEVADNTCLDQLKALITNNDNRELLSNV